MIEIAVRLLFQNCQYDLTLSRGLPSRASALGVVNVMAVLPAFLPPARRDHPGPAIVIKDTAP